MANKSPKKTWQSERDYRRNPDNAIRLTDQQWRKINILNLPDGKRGMIELLMNEYVHFKKSFSKKPNPSKTQAYLDGLQNHLQNFLQQLNDAGDDVLCALTDSSITSKNGQLVTDEEKNSWGSSMSAPPLRLLQYTQMKNLKTQVENNISWIEKAKSTVVKGKTGSDTGDIDYLVAGLDKIIFSHSGKHINRASKGKNHKDFIGGILKIIDPQIGDGSIDEAMKRYIGGLKASSKRKK